VSGLPGMPGAALFPSQRSAWPTCLVRSSQNSCVLCGALEDESGLTDAESRQLSKATEVARESR
jgi:hypothetical protein